MRKVFKLFTAVLVLGFMVGCGGGGSSSSGDNSKPSLSISFADVDNAFVPFPDVSPIGISIVEKDKIYNATQDAIDDFTASVIIAGGYTPSGSWYATTDSVSNIIYGAKTDNSTAIGTIQTAILSYSNFTGLTDAVFESEFDEFNAIDANIVSAFIETTYDDNISTQYTAYALSLYSQKFDCTKGLDTNNKYVCTKPSSDGLFLYVWIEKDDFSYQYLVRAI
ncbi:MAG: hypothetical protein LBJ88_05375 [Campylobacteraceae bacterium]|jgi:hypothetical protein|nr:hypothetical protein [Campylobacteraceae bacterium]